MIHPDPGTSSSAALDVHSATAVRVASLPARESPGPGGVACVEGPGVRTPASVGSGTNEAALVESPAVKMAGDASDDGSWVGPCIDVRDNGPGTELTFLT